MFSSKYSGLAVLLLVALPLILSARSARDPVVPLKNWDTPLYWHPNPTERSAGAKPVPQALPGALSQDALVFVAMTPCRLVDTRGAAQGFDGSIPFSGLPGPLPASQTVTFPVLTYNMNTMPAPCGTIPLIAEAYSLNVTVIPVTTAGTIYVEAWPNGTPQPYVSTLDDPLGTVVANAVIVAAGAPDGGINVFNDGPGTINVIIDMNGYFAAPTDLNFNTASGVGTLAANTSGQANTAVGDGALQSNTSGSENAASGVNALFNNTTGIYNTASGYRALYSNTTGWYNTASGSWALLSNTTGYYNTASGFNALYNNTTGGNNTAVGYQALPGNSIGANNIAIGCDAAYNAPITNSNSIYIGSNGSSGDSAGIIQVGTQGTQTGGTFIAGIYAATAVSGLEVYVNSSGQLSTMNSSGRFKEQITDMGDSSS